MTAVTSATTNSFFKKRYKDEIAENKRMFILNWIMAVIGLPLLTVIGLIVYYYEEIVQRYNYNDDTLSMFAFVGVFALIVSGCIGLSAALFHFRYLYTKSIVDMHYSFPLNGKQRFFADYLAGLTVFLAPIISEIILSIGIVGVASGFMDLSEFWEIFGKIIMLVIMGIIVLTYFYTINVFSITLCGSKFEAGFGCFAINSMIPATVACVWYGIMQTAPFGMDGESILYNPIFTATSPVGAVISAILWMDSAVNEDENIFATYLRWMLIVLIFIGIYLVSAFLIYKNRKAEDVSKPYITKIYYYAVMTMAVFCIISLFIANDVNPVPGVLICAIMWFIMELIERRGFKRFWTAGISFALAVGGVFAVEGICIATNGFNVATKIPSSISVSSVEIYGYPILQSEIKTDERDIINSVIDFQKEAVDKYKHPEKYEYALIEFDDSKGYYDSYEYPEYFYDSVTVNICYNLVSGSKMIRRYNCPSYMLSDLVKRIAVSEEYASDITNEFILHSYNSVASEIDGLYYSSVNDAEKRGSKAKVIFRRNVLNETYSLYYEKAEIHALADALKHDLMNRTEEDLKNHTVVLTMNDIEIFDTYTETLAFLGEEKIRMITEDEAEYAVESGKISAILFDPVFYADEAYLFTDKGVKDTYYRDIYSYYDSELKYSVLSKITTLTGYLRSYSTNYEVIECDDYKTLAEFLNHTTRVGIDISPIAVVKNRNGDVFFIPDTPETRVLAEKLKKTVINRDENNDNYYSPSPVVEYEYAY